MIATGIVRKVDALGRVVIPKNLRKTCNLNHNDAVEIFQDGERIGLIKYAPACIFCGEVENVSYFKEKIVCTSCINEAKGHCTA